MTLLSKVFSIHRLKIQQILLQAQVLVVAFFMGIFLIYSAPVLATQNRPPEAVSTAPNSTGPFQQNDSKKLIYTPPFADAAAPRRGPQVGGADSCALLFWRFTDNSAGL